MNTSGWKAVHICFNITTEASKVVLRKNIQQKQTKLKVIRTAKNLRMPLLVAVLAYAASYARISVQPVLFHEIPPISQNSKMHHATNHLTT